MSIRPLRIWPDPILSSKAQPVAQVDDAVRNLIHDMFETMYDSHGIGLAANQIGELQQVIVVDLDPKREALEDEEVAEELKAWGFKEPLALINPVIIEGHGDILWEEGCLSVPGIIEAMQRKEHIVVEALDPQGQKVRIEAKGLFAVAIQHEIDHLQGRVFVEYLSRVKQEVVKRKMKKLKVSL